ncbi:MAG: nitroreductase family protein, partial [Acidimicrobiia bacterium]|nr:nitroreductase family protein [Acidimicrobiia bacterium]
MTEPYVYPRPEDAAKYPFVEHRIEQYDAAEQEMRGEAFLRLMEQRRSVRTFSDDPVPRQLLELAIQTAATAPSGAHMQPWKFVVIGDTEIKQQIRQAAEEEERLNYQGR